MPIYTFHCNACDKDFDRMVPLADFELKQPCEACQSGETERVICAVGVNFVGDDWVSKNGRVKKAMADRRAMAGRKQEERLRDAPPVKLVPNVEGERVSNWSEAQRLAADKGKDATTYAPMVAKERSQA